MMLDKLLASPCSALLVGFGVTNRAVAAALVRRGHTVVVIDDRSGDDVHAAAADLGLVIADDPDAITAHVSAADLVIPTPGLPEQHRVFAAAERSGVPIVSELDLAAVWDDRPVVAITGTNGKTTVVELAVAALAEDGRVAIAAGNTDIPLVAAIEDQSVEVFVVEASSFRLTRAERFQPLVGAWLNFAPDHLDIHADLGAYEAAKARLFELVPVTGTVVANAGDPVVMRNVPNGSHLVTFGTADADWRIDGDDLVGPQGPFTHTTNLWRSLPHDIDNTLAVAALLGPIGVEPAAVARAAASFPTMPHRLVPVGQLDGQTYFDDSKATTPHATLAALRGFAEVVLIAGGKNKGIDLGDLAAGASHVRAVVAIGEAMCDVAAAFADHTRVEKAATMEAAVDVARGLSGGEVPVLLSPGCASFDWYSSYGERGDDFARIVRERGAKS
jgi:UDP-N-acetylmuramoylalanine--D-glutamate ligase